MSQHIDNVTPLRPGQGAGGNGGGNNFGERLVRVETKLETMATKEDIQKIKVWILGGLLGGLFGGITTAALIMIAIVKFLIVP